MARSPVHGPGKPPPVADAGVPVSPWRRRACLALAAVMAVLCGLGFLALTMLTLGLWLAGENRATTPVVDLGFLALGGVMLERHGSIRPFRACRTAWIVHQQIFHE